ncbi:MAG: hypothetical protein U0P45_00005 [Acidimicrobiales bacterium]
MNRRLMAIAVTAVAVAVLSVGLIVSSSLRERPAAARHRRWLACRHAANHRYEEQVDAAAAAHQGLELMDEHATTILACNRRFGLSTDADPVTPT